MNIVLKALTSSITSDQKYSSSSSSTASLSTISTTASSIPTPTIISKDVKPRVGVSTRRSSSLHTTNNYDKNNSKDVISKASSNNNNNNNSSHDEIIRMINQVNNDDKLQSQIMSLLKQEKKLTYVFNDYHPIHFNNSNNSSSTSGSSNDSNYGSLSTNLAVTSSGVKRKHITVDDKNISNNPLMNESKSDLTTTASTTGVNTSTATTMAASLTNQRYHHNDAATQQSYTNNILKMSNKENISHLFQNRNINNIISGTSRYDSGEIKVKSSSSSSSLSPLKTIPCSLKDQIINIKNKSILHSINDINNNNNKWIKPKIDDNDHDKQDMRSIIEKRMGALRKFLDVDQDNVTTTDTLDITGFTGFF